MIDILIEVWSAMQNYEFFYYVPCMAVLLGFVGIFRGFTGKGVLV